MRAGFFVLLSLLSSCSTVTFSILLSSPDWGAEQRIDNGIVSCGDGDLEMYYDSNAPGHIQAIALFVPNINIPQGSLVTTAFVRFFAEKSDTSSPVDGTIYLQDIVDPPSFNPCPSGNFTLLPTLQPGVPWIINGAWTFGSYYVTPNLAPLFNSPSLALDDLNGFPAILILY